MELDVLQILGSGCRLPKGPLVNDFTKAPVLRMTKTELFTLKKKKNTHGFSAKLFLKT